MDRPALADRLVTYSDTVVAFALVNGFAFLITLGEPDIRCSIADVSEIAFALNLLFPPAGTYALFWLQRYETLLRYGSEADEATAPPEDELVSRFWRIAFFVRIGLIWLFGTIVIVGIYGATRDPRCMALPG